MIKCADIVCTFVACMIRALMSEVISLQCACSSGVLDKIEKALLCARLYAEREDAFLSTNRPLARY